MIVVDIPKKIYLTEKKDKTGMYYLIEHMPYF